MAVPVDLQAGVEVAWAIFNLLVGGGFMFYLYKGKMSVETMAFAWFLGPARLAEGVAFLLKGVTHYAQSAAVWDTAFLFIQVAFHTPWLWASWYYIYAYDRPKSLKAVMKRCLLISGFAGVLVMFLHAQPLQKLVAGVLFELPLVGALVGGFCLLVASGRSSCTEKALRRWIAIYMALRVVGYCNHVYQGAVLFNEDLDTEASFVASKVLSCMYAVAVCWLAAKAAELKGFQEPSAEGGSAWVTEPPFKPSVELTHSFAISPDRLWSFSFVFYALAYGFSASCLFLITKPDFERDPIVQIYHTIHPCILLDYLPGTLFAQPFFDFQVYVIGFAMQAGFARKLLEGDYTRIFVGAASLCLFIVTSLAFQLVFTFNPTKVSVMAHSIPYMLWVSGVCAFVFSETFSVYMAGGLWTHPGFTAYAFLTIMTVIYGEAFMLDTFMRNLEVVEKSMDPSQMHDPPEDFEWDHKPAVTSILLTVLFFIWYKLSPRATTAVAFDVATTSAVAPVAEQNEQEKRESNLGHLGFVLPITSPLKFATAVGSFTLVLAGYMNRTVHGEIGEWRKSLTTLPGAAVAAVGWLLTAFMLLNYLLCEIYYHVQCNPSKAMRAAVGVAGSLLGFSSLCVHGSTIPGAPDAYYGAEAFATAMVLWLIVQVVLLVQDWNRLSPRGCVQQLIASVLALVLIVVGTVTQSQLADFGSFFAVFLWAMGDARNIHMVFSGFRIVEATHGAFPPVWIQKDVPRVSP